MKEPPPLPLLTNDFPRHWPAGRGCLPVVLFLLPFAFADRCALRPAQHDREWQPMAGWTRVAAVPKAIGATEPATTSCADHGAPGTWAEDATPRLCAGVA